mmetsp:Transcript_8380/g.12773  ORF Transcript_8380/g.12773 Transcript_8380/m.12773 type:complete len:81 (-) Transcript_8380:312-554(-)
MAHSEGCSTAGVWATHRWLSCTLQYTQCTAVAVAGTTRPEFDVEEYRADARRDAASTNRAIPTEQGPSITRLLLYIQVAS